MASLLRAAWVPLALLAMVAGPDDVRSRAAEAPAATAAGDTLRELRPLIPVRLVRPGGIQIRSVRDNRARILRPAWRLAATDTARTPRGAMLPLLPSPTSLEADLSSLEARLREYFDRRLLEFETRQNATLAALTRTPAVLPALHDTVYVAQPSTRRDTVFVTRPRTARDTVFVARRAGLRDTVFVRTPPAAATERPPAVTIIQEPAEKTRTTTEILAGTATAGLVGGAVAGAVASGHDSVRVDTVYVTRVDSSAAAHAIDESSFPPAPVIEFVERAVLDTGLLRTVSVVFEVNEARLLPASMPVLNSLGRVLVRYPDIRVEIGGHTDSVGLQAYNMTLSQARADSVRTYLVKTFPIAPRRLTTRGYGEGKPVATNHTATGRTLNRRVEFTVIPADTTR